MSEKNAVKNEVNYVLSLKFVCLQMRTVLTQCLQQGICNYLDSSLGVNGYEILKDQTGELLKEEDEIFFCNTEKLLEILLCDAQCIKGIADYYRVDFGKLQSCASALLKKVKDVSYDEDGDIENVRFMEYMNDILALCECFVTVRGISGELYYSTVVKLYSRVENKKNFAPVYNISKTIADQNLDIEYPDFIICCRNADAVICTKDNEICFSTNDKQKVMEEVKKCEAKRRKEKQDKTKKTNLLKIAAICLAVIIAGASAWASSNITKNVIAKKDRESNSESSYFDLFPSRSQNSSNAQKTSSNDKEYKTPVDTVADANGRITSTYSVMNRYAQAYGLNTDYYNEHNGDVGDQPVVYVNLCNLEFSKDQGGEITLYIENNTQDLIRNISFEFRLYSENGQYITGIKSDKLMAEENITLSLDTKKSKSINHKIELDKWEQPDVDIAFVRTDVVVSYDVVE